MNRKLEERDKENPDVALIRKTSSTNTERGWRYIKLILQKTNLENSELENWLNKEYHELEERQFIELIDTRPIAGALFYIGGIRHGDDVSKKRIREIMRPLAQNTLDRKIKDVIRWLNV